MSNYDAMDQNVRNILLPTEELCIPLSITANATPASKVVVVGEPSITFLNTQGQTNITVANGASDSASELSAISYASATDSTGVLNVLLLINEPIVRVNYVQLIPTGGGPVVNGTFPSGAPTGITSEGNKVAINFATSVNFSTTSLSATLVICYVVGQS